MSGSPAFENATWLRAVAAFTKLPNLVRKVRDLEREIQKLKTALQPEYQQINLIETRPVADKDVRLFEKLNSACGPIRSGLPGRRAQAGENTSSPSKSLQN